MLPTVATPTENWKSSSRGASTRVGDPRSEHPTAALLAPVRRRTAERLQIRLFARRRFRPRQLADAGPIPDSLRRALPSWQGRGHMLRLIDAMATDEHLVTLCKAAGLAVDTWRAITINDAMAADSATGHNIRTSKEEAAAQVGREAKTVQRTRRINQQLGIMLEVYGGRTLSGEERKALVRDAPGSTQRGIPSVWVMGLFPPRIRARLSTEPPGRWSSVKSNVHLPPKGAVRLFSHLLDLLTTANAHALSTTDAATRRQPQPNRRPATALGIEILGHPGLRLFDGCSPGMLAPLLAPYQRGGWHGSDLARVLIAEAEHRRLPCHDTAHHPLAALKFLLSGIDPISDPTRDGFTTTTPQPVVPPQPCGHPDCDGHGWINLNNGAAKCPYCPPGARGWVPPDEPAAGTDEPPF